MNKEEAVFDSFSKMIENCINTDTKIIGNLLEKIDTLQKENEQLKEDSISKDIIRNKIKELGSIKGDLATYIAVTEKMKILNELLGE